MHQGCNLGFWHLHRKKSQSRSKGLHTARRIHKASERVRISNMVRLAFDAAFGSHMVLQQAPSMAAVHGTVTGSGNTAPMVLISLVRDASRSSRATVMEEVVAATTLSADGMEWRWRVLFRPVSSSPQRFYTVVAGNGSVDHAFIDHVQFGDVWICAGQSNMAIPLLYSYAYNTSVTAIRKRKYGNVRFSNMWIANIRTDDVRPPHTSRWFTPGAGVTPVRLANSSELTMPLSEFCAECWYFAESLTDMFIDAGLDPPTLGLYCICEGGSAIERWAPASELKRRCSHTFYPSGEAGGDLYEERVHPLTKLSVKGFLWHQGEQNVQTHAVSGNWLSSYGYGCELPALISLWREAFSHVDATDLRAAGQASQAGQASHSTAPPLTTPPFTTPPLTPPPLMRSDPLAPFGVVTLHPRAGWRALMTYLLIYLLTYLITYLPTYLLRFTREQVGER